MRWTYFLCGLLLALISMNAGCSGESAPAATDRLPDDPPAAAIAPVQELLDFAALVEQYGKAVVNIDVVGRAQMANAPAPLLDDPFFEFFRRFGVPLPDDGAPAQPPVRRGSGSGFIVSLDEPIEQTSTLLTFISRQKPGDTCTLTIWRGRKEQTLKVRIAELEESDRDATSDSDEPAAEGGARFGLVVRPLAASEREASGVSHGVLVERVSGNAARAGVQPGDIVVGLNSRAIRSVEDLRSATRDLNEGATAALLIQRDGGQLFIPVRVGKSAEQ